MSKGKGGSPTSLSCLLSNDKLPCILCDHVEDAFSALPESGDTVPFPLFPNRHFFPGQRILGHLALVHHVIISKVETILDLSGYLGYWKTRLEGPTTLADVASQIDTQDDSEYWLLGEILPEDRSLREGLHERVLKRILDEQRREQASTTLHQRKCLFCTHIFDDSLSELFTHMFNEHGFHVGRLDNLVFVEELLDTLHEKVEGHTCVYCDRTFPSYAIMKLHMRKKRHFKINPSNNLFDRFYVVNYRDEQPKDDDEELQEGEDEESWAEWGDKDQEEDTKCLFCARVDKEPAESLEHCKLEHGFDLRAKQKDFYDTIKMINFIRRQVQNGKCPYCSNYYGDDIEDHMQSNKHCEIPDDLVLDEQYMFPTIECDPLLFGFEE